MTEEKDLYYDLICFLATSARGSVKEPNLYGSFRMVEAIERLIDVMGKRKDVEDFYLGLRDEIKKRKYSVMEDEREFIEFLDDIVNMLVEKDV